MQTPKSKPSSLEVPQRRSPLATPRTARKLKTTGPDTDSAPSPNKPMRTPKSSPKVSDRRSPISEKQRPSRAVSEFESQLAQLQDQLGLAQREAEQARSELRAMSAKLEESENNLTELTNSEDDRIRELRELSQERDKAWESELEAVHKQHSMDTTALASAIGEVQKLKAQLDRADSSQSEVGSLRAELSEALGLVRRLRDEVDECRELEARAAVESEQSKARVKSLEGLVGKLQVEVINGKAVGDGTEGEVARELRAELGSVKSEVVQLRSMLDSAEVRYQEEFIRSTLQIRSAYEQAEQTRVESAKKEAELASELKEWKAIVENLKVRLMDKETELQSISEENLGLISKFESEEETRGPGLKAEMESISEENKKLKAEAEDQGRKTEQVEGELRRVKVQADQWRKAAEAAAAMLSTGGNGKVVGSIDFMGSPCSEELDDDSPKKKNGNVLKKIGVLWKKGHQK